MGYQTGVSGTESQTILRGSSFTKSSYVFWIASISNMSEMKIRYHFIKIQENSLESLEFGSFS